MLQGPLEAGARSILYPVALLALSCQFRPIWLAETVAAVKLDGEAGVVGLPAQALAASRIWPRATMSLSAGKEAWMRLRRFDVDKTRNKRNLPNFINEHCGTRQ